MRVWGITGTNGKTTSVWIAAEFIGAVRKCGYITTVEVFDGEKRFSTGYTTPPLAELKKIFAAMEKNGCEDCVMEVSSHAIHQQRTGDTVFAGGAFTNLSEDHLDYHKTMEEYFRVKLSFAERMARPSPSPDMGRKDFPPFVVCLDGGYGKEMLEAVGKLALNALPITEKRPRFNLDALKLVGAYNRSNVLVAATLAEAAGVPHETIERIIPTLTPKWGRLEEVKIKGEGRRPRVFVDFAHTPDGLEKVLTAAREFTKGRLWVVFGAGGDRDAMKRPLMGEVCARLADRLVVTSDNPRSEDPLKIIEAIMEGVSDKSKATVLPDRREAIYYALKNAQADDVIIVAGKGHERTQEIKGEKLPFSDCEVIASFSGRV